MLINVMTIAALIFLIVGAVLAILAAAFLSASEPFGRLTYFRSLPDELTFNAYACHFLAFFPLMMSAAFASDFFSFWALLIFPLGYFPGFTMIYQHNKQVKKMWDSLTVEDFVEAESPYV